MNHSIIWLLAIGYSISENNYFHWNFSPKSDTEMICDGIQAILFVLALLATDMHSTNTQ
jgi:hypothetical protein